MAKVNKFTPEQLAEINKKLSDFENTEDLSDFKEQSDDVVGFWAEDEGPIYGVPRGSRVFDSSIDERKMSGLITFELLAPCVVSVKDNDGERSLEKVEKGSLVGVWAKPGMKPLKRLQGVAVIMSVKGEKDIGKPNPMVTYTIKSKSSGTTLELTSDTRNKSKNESNWLTEDIGAKQARRRAPESPDVGEEPTDNIPF